MKNLPSITINATFNVEPIKKHFNWWKGFLNWQLDINCNSYSQIINSLYDNRSGFYNDDNIVNFILLRLEDWTDYQNTLSLCVTHKEKEELLENLKRTTLPDETEIAHLHEYETDFLYNEIFNEQVYFKHDIKLNDDACVIDIGANIGMFSLYVKKKCKNPRIYAFEPIQATAAVLRANMHLYKLGIAFQQAVSNLDAQQMFTAYQNTTVFSGKYASIIEDKQKLRLVIKKILACHLEKDQITADHLNELVEQFLTNRLEQTEESVVTRRLSTILKEQNIKTVDLLKIDAEGSELDIFQGIEKDDWKKIKQIVMEIHANDSDIQQVSEILASNHFDVTIDYENMPEELGFVYIYAKQRDYNNQVVNTSASYLDGNFSLLYPALTSYSKKMATPLYIIFTANNLTAEMGRYKQKFESLMLHNVYCIASQDLTQSYKCSAIFDKSSEALAAIPYTNSYYLLLATFMMRKIYLSMNPNVKVIVVDCDNTLWGGECSEMHPHDLSINDEFILFQEFLLSQKKMGRLLCIASKNNEEDVIAAFNGNKRMRLEWDDFVCKKVNWQPKSNNIMQIAHELNLHADSFVFIDDNPIECFHVRMQLPQVMTIPFPINHDTIPTFIKQIWCLDKPIKLTEVDANRSEFYKQEIERNSSKSIFSNFEEYLNHIQLNIQISALETVDYGRASQLTHRTNQFNLTTRRRNEQELMLLIENNDNCFAYKLTVRDKFGDYGFVGLIIFTLEENKLIIDTMLLSCRAFSRRIEYAMLEFILTKGHEHNCESLVIPFYRTHKNDAAKRFIEQILWATQAPKDSTETNYHLHIKSLEKIPYKDPEDAQQEEWQTTEKNALVPLDFSIHAEALEIIITKFNTLSAIENYMRQMQQRQLQLRKEIDTVQNKISSHFEAQPDKRKNKIIAIWSQLFNVSIEEINMDIDFFTMGGDSILAIQFISLARAEGIKLSIKHFENNPKITDLASLIELSSPQTFPVQKKIDSFAPLLPFQFLYTFTKIRNIFTHQITPKKIIDINILRAACAILLQRHDVLRIYFSNTEGEWRQELSSVVNEDRVFAVDFSNATDLDAAIRDYCIEIMHDIGPDKNQRSFKLILAEYQRQQKLVLVIDHYFCDLFSLQVFWQELFQLYEGASLPIIETSYCNLINELVKDVNHWDYKNELSYWFDILDKIMPFPRTAPDATQNSYDIVALDEVSLVLSKRHALRNLTSVFSENNIRPLDCFLAAWAMAMSKWSNKNELVILISINNRHMKESMDQIIGPFTTSYPLLLELSNKNPKQAVLYTKQQVDNVPYAGSRYYYYTLHQEARQLLWEKPQPFLIFNFASDIINAPFFDRYMEIEDLNLNKYLIKEDMKVSQDEVTINTPLLALSTHFINKDSIKLTCGFNPAYYSKNSVSTLLEYFEYYLSLVCEDFSQSSRDYQAG